MQTNTDKLAPCPFCGGNKLKPTNIQKVYKYLGLADRNIICEDCDVIFEPLNCSMNVFDWWNTRALSVPRVEEKPDLSLIDNREPTQGEVEYGKTLQPLAEKYLAQPQPSEDEKELRWFINAKCMRKSGYGIFNAEEADQLGEEVYDWLLSQGWRKVGS